MKKIINIFAVALFSLVALPALSDTTGSDVAHPVVSTGHFYLGLRAANMGVDEEEIDDLKDDPNGLDIKDASYGSLLFGYDFGNTVSVELEIGSSEHDVTFDTAVPDQTLDMSTLGLYVVYRNEGQWYFKGRGGLLSRTIELDPGFAEGDDKENDSFISIGIGGGVRIESFSIEVEFVSIESGIGSFGLAGLYNF